jgi:potassium-dependent mechanosensitive channel
MNTKRLYLWSVVRGFLAVAIVSGLACHPYFQKDDDALHIALACPMTGESAGVGNAFLQGIELYLDRVNRQGGVNGKRVVLDVYDDRNRPELAEKRAADIVEDGRAAAVIGHYYSSCSIRAGEIYKTYRVPAVSPAATNVKITQDNPWYFRTIFNDRSQGRFLATYANKVFGHKTASIIHEDQEYGAYLAKVFEQTCSALGVEVKYKWGFDAKDDLLDQNLIQIVNELQYKPDAGVIFLATHAPEGARLIRLMKDSLVGNPVMGPDAFSSESFREIFREFPKERTNPGFYTDGMYVTTPLIFDTTNEQGLQFKEAYLDAYGEEPGWHSAFAYDTAMILVAALEKTGVAGRPETLETDREKIRRFLANLTNPYDAIEGVTGYNYFDDKGDSQKPIFIGVYRRRNIVSAMTQFRPIPNLNDVPNFEKAVKEGRILLFDGRYSYKINVVYTGIRINSITEADPETFNAAIDFFLWFRYRGDIDLKNIEFLNALEPVQLGEPVREQIEGDQVYHLYHVKAPFQSDFLPGQHIFGQHILGMRFRPRGLDRNNLIFVKDVLGMRLKKGVSPAENMRENQVMAATEGWRIARAWFFQDIAEKDALGDPDYLHLPGGALEFSRFNVGIRIKPDRFTLRREVPEAWAGWMLLIATLVSLFLSQSIKGRLPRAVSLRLSPKSKILWGLQILVASVWLLSAEVCLLQQMGPRLNATYFETVRTVFDVLWWLAAAHFLSVGLERFIWVPLEDRTGRDIPHIVRNIIAFIIYLLALFAIVAFVFDQKLTSLLATSGVIAMILGLAVQINIANIFSGIAINLERPFRIDDWVKIGSFTEGKVVDINWRTTRLLTRDRTILSIPNSQASESSIENFSFPNDTYFKYFTVHVEPHHEPERVKKVLLNAALATDGVVYDPPPATRFLGLTDEMTGPSRAWAANYLISVVVRDYGMKFAHNEMIWLNVWTHLHHAGIRLLTERHEIQMALKGKKETVARPLSLLQELDIFDPFSHEAKVYLGKRMKRRYYDPGQEVVRQGDAGDSLFVIAEGVLSVRAKSGEREAMEVARLGAGDFFGEMALLTGEPRTATLAAVTDTLLYEITKEDISPLLERQPEISWSLTDVLVKRKQATATATAKTVSDREAEKTLSAQILGKIQRFFGFRS